MQSPAKRARDAAVDAQLATLARAAGVVFHDRELLGQVLELLRAGIPARNIVAVARRLAEAEHTRDAPLRDNLSTATRH